jgi:hypothetical protein
MKQTSFESLREAALEVGAFITKNKQRLKQTNMSVYLDDKQEFEIELYNPKKTSVLAKIKLNGNYIKGGGIILRPGERIFLERFLDTNNKFMFNTYTVDGSKESLEAISENGKVSVEFYDESFSDYIYRTTTITTYPTLYFCAQNTLGLNTPIFSGGSTFVGSITSNNNLTSANTSQVFNTEKLKASIETGMIDKGKASDQSFVESNKDFNYFSFKTVECQILPLSQKIYVSSDIKHYCTECGAKITKTSFKFCPICGNKI